MTSRKNAVAVLAAVLLIGCLLGVSGFWLWGQRVQSPADINARYSQHAYSSRIFDRLQITSQQEAQLKEILEDSRREINDCRIELQEKMDKIRADTNARIAAILDENQKKIFETLIDDTESLRRNGHHGRGRKTSTY